jgi:hypothetical protein
METAMDTRQIKILTISLFIFTLFSLLFSFTAFAAPRGLKVISDLSHQSGKLGAYRALIIGINDYKDPKIPDLETAVSDANAMAKLLRELYGFQVNLLLNRKATKKAIYQALRSLASSTKPDDSVLIYYAGHGDLDRTYDDGWWIPVDATGGDPVTYLDNGQVQKSMRSMNARHVLLISDSCYSGTLFGQARAMPQVIDDKYYLNLYNEKSRWGLTSGNKTPVSDQGTGGHSVFAYQLLKELRKNDNPYISTQEIYTRIAPIISNNSEQIPLCRPVRNTGDQGGEFVFIRTTPIVPKPWITKKTNKPPPEARVKAPTVEKKPTLHGVGDIFIESDPSEAVVYLDNEEKGTTPLELTNVPAGVHSLELRKEKIYAAKLEIDLKPDAVLKEKVRLNRLQGKIKISSKPYGAKIFLDGQDTGKFTPDVIHTEAGEHALKLEKETKGYLITHEGKILVEPDRKVDLRITDFVKIINSETLNSMLDCLILNHIFDNMKDKHKYGTVEQWEKRAPEDATYRLALAKGSGRFFVNPDNQQFFFKAGKVRIPLDLSTNPANVSDTDIDAAIKTVAALLLSGEVDRARFRGIEIDDLPQYLKELKSKQKSDAVKSW